MVFKESTEKIVVLGTGGTIAGTAATASDSVGYRAAQLSVAELLRNLAGMGELLGSAELVTEQVAQLDSKDMDFAVLAQLAERVRFHLVQTDVRAVLITHGTDTLEESAYFLQSVLPVELQSSKPVVLTCAMRPASALSGDGPQNLRDALSVVLTAGACGVMVVCAGTVHGARDVQKVHSYRLDAFSSGDAGALGYVENGTVRLVKNWPEAPIQHALAALENRAHSSDWPRVEIVMNYVGGSASVVDALLQPHTSYPALAGLVVAGTGNGSMHSALEAALRRAVQAGVTVWRSSRCGGGYVIPTAEDEFAAAAGLSPVKARVALVLTLLAGQR